MTKNTFLKIAGGFAAVSTIYGLWLRPWHLNWGATEEEVRMTLPGDELTPGAKGRATHAITIYAPATEIWKWLVQIGQDKGGFYSYSWLENLCGCNLHNAERIIPEFQHLQNGDKVWLHPKALPLPVVHLEANRTLVLGSNTSEPGTWGFFLKPVNANTTRLLIRNRGDWKSGLLRNAIQYGIYEPTHFIMEQKMMRTIKSLAERNASV